VDLDPDLGLGVVMRRKPPLERLFVREGLDPAWMRNNGADGPKLPHASSTFLAISAIDRATAKTDLQ
jgi:hypothetical protein